MQPDLVQVHWLNAWRDLQVDFREVDCPLTIRGQGYELRRDLLAELEAEPAVARIFLSPYFARQWALSPKVVPAWVGFQPELFHPEGEKDRRLVVRTAAGLASKNLDLLIALAERNPSFRFVLAVGHASDPSRWVDGFPNGRAPAARSR
ncbi:MAG: hypothetical protein R2862_00680 [Thermoanaerobaculia bacterium]